MSVDKSMGPDIDGANIEWLAEDHTQELMKELAELQSEQKKSLAESVH